MKFGICQLHTLFSLPLICLWVIRFNHYHYWVIVFLCFTEVLFLVKFSIKHGNLRREGLLYTSRKFIFTGTWKVWWCDKMERNIISIPQLLTADEYSYGTVKVRVKSKTKIVPVTVPISHQLDGVLPYCWVHFEHCYPLDVIIILIWDDQMLSIDALSNGLGLGSKWNWALVCCSDVRECTAPTHFSASWSFVSHFMFGYLLFKI